MSHRHKDCCCCEPVCSCGNRSGNNCGTGSGIWIIILLLVFCSGRCGGFGGLCR